MTVPVMHAETTSDPRVIRWLVRGELVNGFREIDASSPDHMAAAIDVLPPQWISALKDGDIRSVRIAPGELQVTAVDATAWLTLAPLLHEALRARLATGATIETPTTLMSINELEVAVRAFLNGPLRDYVASHGGQVELADISASHVTVRLAGACDGCPSAGQTLREGIEQQLRDRYPQITSVKAVMGSERAEGGRRLLPFVRAR